MGIFRFDLFTMTSCYYFLHLKINKFKIRSISYFCYCPSKDIICVKYEMCELKDKKTGDSDLCVPPSDWMVKFWCQKMKTDTVCCLYNIKFEVKWMLHIIFCFIVLLPLWYMRQIVCPTVEWEVPLFYNWIPKINEFRWKNWH